jgi:MtN3 and saliva related transmembrane protein
MSLRSAWICCRRVNYLYVLAAASENLTTKSAADVSLSMLTIFTTGVGLWLCYGVVLGAWPIILTNGVTLLLTSPILILKLRYQS